MGYLIPPLALIGLHEGALNDTVQPKLWIEDVFITGIVAQAVGIWPQAAAFSYPTRDNLLTFGNSLVMGEIGREKAYKDFWRSIYNGSSQLGRTTTSVSSGKSPNTSWDMKVCSISTEQETNSFFSITKDNNHSLSLLTLFIFFWIFVGIFSGLEIVRRLARLSIHPFFTNSSIRRSGRTYKLYCGNVYL
jgi:hypothetical protein